METSMQEEVSQSAIQAAIPEPAAPRGVPQRVWDRIARQFESTAVTKRWEEAVLRITQEAHPEYTPQQLQDVVLRWRLLTGGMGVAASTVDIAAASIFTGMGLRGIFRFTPIHPEKHPALYKHMARGKTSGVQWRDNALRQMAFGSPMVGLAGATVAIRPAQLGLSLAGQAAGVAGENVSRIVRRITHDNAPVDLPTSQLTDTVYYGRS